MFVILVQGWNSYLLGLYIGGGYPGKLRLFEYYRTGLKRINISWLIEDLMIKPSSIEFEGIKLVKVRVTSGKVINSYIISYYAIFIL